MQACQVYLVRRRKTITNLAVYAYLLVAFALLHTTSLPSILVTQGVLIAFAVLLLFDRSRTIARGDSAVPWGGAKRPLPARWVLNEASAESAWSRRGRE
jgi:hypothetical protein